MFSIDEAKIIGDKLNIDWNVVDINEFCMGLNVELEHGSSITNSDPLLTGKVALAHLKELPDYYTRLKKIEK